MPGIEVSTDIDRPPAAVWEVVRHVPAHVDWMVDAEAIRVTSPPPLGAGTTFDCDTRVGPFHLTDRMRITEWDEGTAMGVHHEGVVTGTGRFTLTPLEGGTRTRFTWAEDLTFPWWMGGRLGAAAGRPVLAAVWRRNLRALAAIVEGTPAP